MIESTSDVLVIGGGAAGSRAALEATRSCPKLEVTLAVAGKYGKTGSTQLIASECLGINAPFDFARDGDNPEIYFEDMLATGGGLCSPALCRIIADESCARIKELMDLGMHFDTKAGVPIQIKLSGSSKARSLSCGGSTGRRMLEVLKKANAEVGVKVLEGVRILELLQDKRGRVCGAIGLYGDKQICIRAGAIILAMGGAGRLFRRNVNPPTLEGDGWAMAYRAGARLVNLEFFQVGPAVMKPRIQFIIHSHMWKLKPRLTNVKGEEFLAHYCPDGIVPADVIDAKTMSYPFSLRTVAKYLDIAIFKELTLGRGTANDGVYFDVTHAGQKRLMQVATITYETLKKAGADLAKERIELGLAVQNFNGGILIDENGYTGVEGLYAAGEITGGVHGADRPGGNNLIDTQVFGCRSGRTAAAFAETVKDTSVGRLDVPVIAGEMARSHTSEQMEMVKSSADLYYRELTIVRRAEGLKRVLSFIDDHKRKAASYAALNRLSVGQFLALAALTREESRGTHYREDFPCSDSKWNQRVIIRKGNNGEPAISIGS